MKQKKQNELLSLLTPWAEAASTPPLQEYPRPLLRRRSYFCLNGEWEFSAEGVVEGARITVPFPPESLLSGIGKSMGSRPRLHYRKRFTLPEGFVKARVLLHFGAVDQTASVTLNGTPVGRHEGGYDAFCFDVTELLQDENCLEVFVTDALEDHVLPWGKQKQKRGGMWYTPVSGIWQTVWMESVPQSYVQALEINADTERVRIRITGIEEGEITVRTPDGDIESHVRGGALELCIRSPRLWSPEDPYLYRFTLRAGEDEVESYFAMRSVSVERVGDRPRILLNGKPYFFHGLLDQGYFSDGIYTPASYEAYANDILSMKRLGFNMLRKHIKLEPRRFYYECDRLGMIVFQDMVNNGGYSFLRDTALPTVGMKRLNDKWLHRNKVARQAFLDGMKKTVEQLRNHPCICYWTVFNEGWGQFESDKAYQALRSLDPTRVIDSTSGWFWGKESDVDSHHVYFKPVRLKQGNRPTVLSEFGGYSCQMPGHVFHPAKEYGYRSFKDAKAFEDALVELYEQEILPAIQNGLCAAVLTQVSDVEDETNGLLTYDRRVCKVEKERMRLLSQRLFEAYALAAGQETRG